MKLISNEKIAEFQKNNPVLLSNINECAAAKLALDFAETELRNLAIEYAEWYRRVFHESFSKWCELSQQELFDKFIKTRIS